MYTIYYPVKYKLTSLKKKANQAKNKLLTTNYPNNSKTASKSIKNLLALKAK